MKLIIPLFFVIQLHLFNSPGSVVTNGLCCCIILVTAGSRFSRDEAEIKPNANEIFSSKGVKESAWEESFEFCDKDNETEDKDKDEVLFWSPIG